jgi:hypothetical protein
MEEVSELEINPLTSSLYSKNGWGWRSDLPPHYRPISRLTVVISFNDDVTVILLLGISFILFGERESLTKMFVLYFVQYLSQ